LKREQDKAKSPEKQVAMTLNSLIHGYIAIHH
jgi:hypothetical protein